MMRRRQFLKLLATSAGGGVLFQACATGSPRREFKIESPATIPEDALYGDDAWFASVCGGCAAGCGIVARVFEGRVKKIEGNPNHPVNQGGLCPRGQALVQDIYHPDRIQTPLRRVGPRGAGQFEAIGWDAALDALAQALREHATNNGLVMLTEPLSGPLRLVADRFAGALGGRRLAVAPLEDAALRAAVRNVFGAAQLPTIDLANARFVLSFGADFLHTWIAPVQLSRAYGAFRQGRPGQRGTLIQIEPRMSGTAAVADRWVPVAPGAEGLLALAMARVIRDEGLAEPANLAAFGDRDALLAGAAPEDAAGPTGVPADTIRDLARRFANERPSVAFGGGSAAAHTNGLFNLTAIYALNLLVGAVNQPGGLRLPAPPSAGFDGWQPDAPATAADLNALVARLGNGQPAPVGLLLIHAANPLYALPAAGLVDALAGVPSIVSCSRYVDETTAWADLVLPDHTDLESWGATLPATGATAPTVGFQQPVAQPFYGTRAFGDVLLTAAEALGGPVLDALPWNTMRDAVRDAARQLQQAGGEPADADFERFWVQLLQRGVWTAPASAAPAAAAPTLPAQLQPAAFAGDGDYPFTLLPYPSATLGAGEGAHLPWLQALPDPITTATWSSWVEVNAGDAHRLGVGTGDVARIVTPQGQAEVVVYVHPAAPPGVLAVPLGQGHAFSGRYAAGRGINALTLVAPQLDAASGALAWAATRARLETTGKQQTLPRFEGSVTPRAPADYPIVRVTRGDD